MYGKLKSLIVVFLCILFSINAFSKNLRVVSLSTVVTEEIFLLGDQKYLVGCSSYAKLPGGFKVERVGSVVNASLSEILRLKPDYVFVSGMINPMTLRKMRSVGLKVIQFGYPESFNDICNNFLRLASYLGSLKKARKIVNKAKKEVERIILKVQGLKKPTVFVEIGVHPLFTATPHSFINDFIKFAGGVNIACDTKTGLYSVEEVLRKNPDVIIISQMGFDGFKEKKRWERFKFLNAVKNNRILVLDDYSFCSPTPVSFVKTLKKIARFLHPGLSFEN